MPTMFPDDDLDAGRAATPICEFTPEPDAPDTVALLPPAETDLQFFSRRALEESRAALRASSPQAAAAHRYLAAAYGALTKREIETAAELDAIARDID